MQFRLAKDQNTIKNEAEMQRYTREQNASAELVLQRNLENQKIQKDSANEIKRLEIELEKSNMDQNMLRHEALQLAKKCYAGKYIEKTNITNMAKDDSTGALLTGLLQKWS